MANLHKFTCSVGIGRIFKVYTTVRHQLVCRELNIITHVEFYSSANAMLDYNEIRNYLKTHTTDFSYTDFSAYLTLDSTMVRQITGTEGYVDIA